MENNEKKDIDHNKPPDIVTLIDESMKNPEVPKIYANGFVAATGQGDIIVCLQQNGYPTAMLNLSFTLAKTLSLKLGETIKILEEKTGNTIMTSDEVSKAILLNENKESGKKNDKK